MDPDTTSECYSGGDIAGSIIGTLICGALAAYIAWWLYKKYWSKRKGKTKSSYCSFSAN